MPVTSITSDPENLTLTAVADFPVPVERLWQAWMDPRQLERFWGPPQWPATFTQHEPVPGGRSVYYMRGPNGEESSGAWEFLRVEPHVMFELRDGFLHPDGTDNRDLPGTTMRITFESTEGGSRFTSVSTFTSAEALETLLAMGMLEGMTAAMAQIDDVVMDLRDLSAAFVTDLQIEDDTHAVLTRVIRGDMHQVWRAYHEPALLKQWMLGPDGWTMPVCEVAEAVGDTYRYEWAHPEHPAFGFTGELLEQESPRREVSTEQMIGIEGPGTVNELVLVPQAGARTRIELRIAYPSRELRDMILATGMVDGVEASFARLEGLVG